MRVFVHSSIGRPGWDVGRGWYQEAEVTVAGAEIQQQPGDGCLAMFDGSVRVDGQLFDNLIPLPCDMTGKVEIAFSGQEGALAATGSGIRLVLKGEPGSIENFPGVSAVTQTLCLVCGFDLGVKPWEGASGSDEICPSCGIHFGYDDFAAGEPGKRNAVYQAWREQWARTGMRWWSKGRPQPSNWNPVSQLERVTRT